EEGAGEEGSSKGCRGGECSGNGGESAGVQVALLTPASLFLPSPIFSLSPIPQKEKVVYIRIDGSTAPEKRHHLVARFQEDPDTRVAVLGIHAAGVGLTLTAASTVVFAEMAWNPGDLVQAEDRAHRIGQVGADRLRAVLGDGVESGGLGSGRGQGTPDSAGGWILIAVV
ncbi:unnamed protein product, partial [Closterium sp. NIES-54]